MTQADRTQYYEELGDQFEAFMSDYDVDRRLSLVFSTLVGTEQLAGARVLEVGSGTGRFSQEIVRLGGKLTILDIGPQLVSDVATKHSCDGVTGDALGLPFADGSFDIVISSECIEHTLDPELAIREMCRVTGPTGTVCITTPNKLWYPIMRLSQKIGARKYSGIENWLFPTRAADVMRETGIMDVTLSGCHLWPFQFKFTRPLLRRIDAAGGTLYPLMINFGILGKKGA